RHEAAQRRAPDAARRDRSEEDERLRRHAGCEELSEESAERVPEEDGRSFGAARADLVLQERDVVADAELAVTRQRGRDAGVPARFEERAHLAEVRAGAPHPVGHEDGRRHRVVSSWGSDETLAWHTAASHPDLARALGLQRAWIHGRETASMDRVRG